MLLVLVNVFFILYISKLILLVNKRKRVSITAIITLFLLRDMSFYCVILNI